MDLRAAREPLPRPAGVAVLVAFLGLLLAATVSASPGRVALAATAATVAAVVGAVAILGPPRHAARLTAVAAVPIVVVCAGDPSSLGWFALLVLLGWCTTVGPLLESGALAAAIVVLFVVEALVTVSDPGWFAWIAGTAFTGVGCGFGRRQHALVVALRAAQAGLARQAQADERARIARELHDVIAHSLTVSLMHIASARLAIGDDPATAERALAEAERVGRASLDEVRHAVGTLHRADAPDPTAPLPGTTDVPALIETFTAAGADVRADVDAGLERVPATVGLAAYRILQEALTNAAKHAPAARTTVSVRVADDSVRLDVDSAGSPRSGGGGHGLAGMRDRAASVGGTVEAGPGGNGWLVRAVLPVRGAR